MLQFALDGWPEDDVEPQLVAARELGLRLGMRFALHRSLGSAATPVDVCFSGPAAEARPADSCRLNIRFRSGEGGPAAVDGLRVWSVGPADLDGVVAGVTELLSFGHEKRLPKVAWDAMHRIHPEQHPLVHHSLATTPLIENAARLLRDALSRLGYGVGLPDPWGAGRSAVVLTHDVDGPRLHTTFALARSALLGLLRGDRTERASFELGLATLLDGRPDPYWRFDEWILLEQALGVSSTSFFYPGRLTTGSHHSRDPRYDLREAVFRPVLLRLEASGRELGLHTPINGITPETLKESVARFTGLGLPQPLGCRAHYWAIDWRAPTHSWAIMADAGLEYDASLSPMRLGYRIGSTLPYQPLAASEQLLRRPFVALPTAIMDAYAVPRTAGRGADATRGDVDALLAAARLERGLLVLDWHERTLANVGAWKGFLGALLGVLLPLADDSAWVKLSAQQAAERWRTYADEMCELVP